MGIVHPSNLTIMQQPIQEVLDRRGALRCVRFASGEVGVVNARGRTVLTVGAVQQMAFADHGFLRGDNGRTFFVDMKNGAIYARMPEMVRFGDFELAGIGGFLCTRTRRMYEVEAIPAEAWLGCDGLYLKLPFRGCPDEAVAAKMVERPARYEVCLLNGDDSGVYWLMGAFDDRTPLVMDDEGRYFRVLRRGPSGRAVKRLLGTVAAEDDKVAVALAIQRTAMMVADRIRREVERAKREAERERERRMVLLVTAEPFRMGNKWGLKNKGRIVVPPIYRQVRQPVGKYCAIEVCPGVWGVMAVDGRVEVEARYEDVVIHADGTVELTIRPGMVVRKRLP